MQINGIGNNQIGNSYQNPNRMPNSTASKKEEDDINQRLEALGVKVELSFRQPAQQEQEQLKETTEPESASETFSVLTWVKKIWDAGIAWLKSFWNDEAGQEQIDAGEAVSEDDTETMESEEGTLEAAEMFETQGELVEEFPVDEGADYSAVYAKTTENRQEAEMVDTPTMPQSGQFDFRVADEEMLSVNADKYRRVGTALHTSGMQDSYNRYGQHSKLGVELSNRMTARK